MTFVSGSESSRPKGVQAAGCVAYNAHQSSRAFMETGSRGKAKQRIKVGSVCDFKGRLASSTYDIMYLVPFETLYSHGGKREDFWRFGHEYSQTFV